MDIEGQPLLVRMLERVARIKTPAQIVVATTKEKPDKKIVEICKKNNIQVFRGDSTNLLDRHYQAAKRYKADIVVKIPSDCPLIDPAIIDKVMGRHLVDDCDYTSNLHPATFPDGNDVEVMEFEALESAWLHASRQLEKEHTTPYIWENRQKFRINNVLWRDTNNVTGEATPNYSMTHRWTIDYYEDYEFIKSIYRGLYRNNPNFGLTEILIHLKNNPEIIKINEKYAGVNWYRHHLSDLKTITPAETKSI